MAMAAAGRWQVVETVNEVGHFCQWRKDLSFQTSQSTLISTHLGGGLPLILVWIWNLFWETMFLITDVNCIEEMDLVNKGSN